MTIQTWCLKKLNEGGQFSASASGCHGIVVKRPREPSVVAYCLDSSDEPFTSDDLDAALDELPDIQALVVVNRPLDAGVFENARTRELLVATFGHFERALAQTDITEFVHPEEQYLRKRLGQRREVTRVTRIGMRAWRIDRRKGLRPLTIVTHDRYEFTDDEMWQLVAQGPGLKVDAFVVTNPNSGGFGSRVVRSAANVGVALCTTNEFLDRLGEPWT